MSHSKHSSKSIQEQQAHRKDRVQIRTKRPNSISISNSILNSDSFIETNFNQFKPSNSNHMISSLNQIESDIPYSSYSPSSISTSAQKLSVDCSTITTESNEQDEIDSSCSSLDVASFLASVHSAVSKVRPINQYHQQSIRLESTNSPLFFDHAKSNPLEDPSSNYIQSQITSSDPIATNHQKSLSTGCLPLEFKTPSKITRERSSSSSPNQRISTILSNHSITPEKPKNEFDMKLEILQRAIDTGNFDNLDMPSLIKWEDESDHDQTEITLSNETSNEPIGRIPGTPITLTSSIVYSSTPFILNQTSSKTLLSNSINSSKKNSSNSINGGEDKFGLDIQTIKKTLHTPLLSDTLLDDQEELSFDQQENHSTKFYLPRPPSSSNTSQTDLNRSRSQTVSSPSVSTRNLNNPVDSRLAESRGISTNLKLEKASLFQPVNNKLSSNSRNENQQVFLTKSPYHNSPIESILTQPYAPTSPISSSIPIARQDSFSSFNKSSINHTASIRSNPSTFSNKLKTLGKKLGFNEPQNQIPDNSFVSRNGMSFEHDRTDRSMNGSLHHRISAQSSRSVISSQHTLNRSYNEMVPRNNRSNSIISSQTNQTRISIDHLSNDFDPEEQVENLKEIEEENQSSTLLKNEVEKDFIKNQKINADKNRLNQILLNHQALEKQYMKELTYKSKAKINASTNNNNRE